MNVLTIEETASLLRVSENTLSRWRSQHVGPAFVKIGKKVFYPHQAIADYLADNVELTNNGSNAAA